MILLASTILCIINGSISLLLAIGSYMEGKTLPFYVFLSLSLLFYISSYLLYRVSRNGWRIAMVITGGSVIAAVMLAKYQLLYVTTPLLILLILLELTY